MTRNEQMKTGILLCLFCLLWCYAGCSPGSKAVNQTDGSISDLDTQSGETIFVDLGPDIMADNYDWTTDLDIAAEIEPVDCLQSGSFGCPCTHNNDCESGFCVLHQGDQVCTTACLEECPDSGWTCKEYSGFGDPVFICISDYTNLCWPCDSDTQCTANGTSDSCLDYGESGSFCGGDCGLDDACPSGYHCQIALSTAGMEVKQCVADTDECMCTATAVTNEAWTSCTTTNEWGTCDGLRQCEVDELSPCDAPVPTQETCNGLDDNCDGQVDGPSLCDDDNPCTTDSCEAEVGCTWIPMPEGQECADGNPCTWKDKCQNGNCVGEEVLCFDGNECTLDQCDPTTGDCLFPADLDSNGEPCLLDDLCLTGGLCVDGECLGAAGISCVDGVACTVDDCAPDSGCIHTTDASKCDDDNECTEDLCQPECDDYGNCQEGTGCTNLPTIDGLPCDDSDACTTTDQCASGICQGLDVELDDTNPCTEDSCDPLLGVWHEILADNTPCSADLESPNWVCQDGQCECIPHCAEKVCGNDGCGGFCGECSYPTTVCSDDQAACIGPPCTTSLDCELGEFCNPKTIPPQCLPGCNTNEQCLWVCPQQGSHVCRGDNTCLCSAGGFPGTTTIPADNACLTSTDGWCLTADTVDALAPPQGGMLSGSGNFRVTSTLVE
jgi:hypothetical protein